MDDDVKKYLFDIKTALDSIESYLGDQRNFDKYKKDKMLREQWRENWRSFY